MVMSDNIFLMNEGTILQSDSPSALYTKPQSLFAARFIGNYNIISSNNFERVVKRDVGCDTLAIRPETITISDKSKPDEKEYHFCGHVINSTLLGNIIRYKVDCSTFILDIDVLYKTDVCYNNGQKIYLHINRDDCILVS
jgi:putative spermidine/putrescine transport system ATP-binding protein